MLYVSCTMKSLSVFVCQDSLEMASSAPRGQPVC
ncbi:hypothetical protein E2C01_080814 [Portunus trituberculatus]|uniref:Uncharacterized protein n=1 Tax=Portunus trituberculatus TaxID=210409 RepID=A0A5B7IQB9_PORTR|nr:hypothetical protein [Portunus trituberculatus]